MSEESEKHSFEIPEKKKVPIVICGKTFLFSANFSMNDMVRYGESLERGDSAKYALCSLIYHKLQKCDPPVPTLDELCLENDHSFEPYITAVLTGSSELQTAYANADISLSIWDRFAIANKTYWKSYSKKFAECMQPTLLALAEQIKQSINFSLLNSGIQQSISEYQSMLNGIAAPLVQFTQRTAEILAPIQNTIAQFSNTFADIIANVQIPTFTEERKQELQANYKKWGQLGWSAIPHAPIKLFNVAPQDAKNADRVALRYFGKNGMSELLAMMKEKPIKKDDLTSAVFCFENKQYKACTLLLFGILDAKLIRLQPNKSRRKVGKGAVGV